MKLHSFAKINLTLDIIGKRTDGFHEIETIFQTIDLADTISIEEDPNITVTCSNKSLENNENLAYKAAILLKEKTNTINGARIHIEKIIPVGAGLAGGSSNAAAVLKGLNTLWNLNLDTSQLIEIAKPLGSDVAFHIIGGTCKGSGRGEIIEKVNPLPLHHIIILYPGFPISTKEAYNALDLTQCGKTKATKKYPGLHLHNDFEQGTFKVYPELKALKKILGENSLLSGSGSSVFGLFEKESDARNLYQELIPHYENIFLTKTNNGIQN